MFFIPLPEEPLGHSDAYVHPQAILTDRFSKWNECTSNPHTGCGRAFGWFGCCPASPIIGIFWKCHVSPSGNAQKARRNLDASSQLADSESLQARSADWSTSATAGLFLSTSSKIKNWGDSLVLLDITVTTSPRNAQIVGDTKHEDK